MLILLYFLIDDACPWERSSCLAASEPLVGFTTPELAESLELRQVVAIAQERGHDRVIFASDCLSLVQRCKSSDPDRSTVGLVVLDIKKMVASFISATFKHVSCSLNVAAHTLARTCDLSSSDFISSFGPNSIRQTLFINVM
jgi:hypothetical protein